MGPPGWQVPPAQVSDIVHAFWSSQGAALGVFTQPVAGSHASSVQMFTSSQSSAGPGTQSPPAQASSSVHGSPSEQGPAWSCHTQPDAGSQRSLVQGLPSSQSRDPAPTHAPPAQVSVTVHAFWSSQDAALNVWTQPVAGSHESSVHGFPSSQSSGGPGAQAPPAHASPTVHASPSSQSAVLGALTQPLAGSHESSVHGFPSSQSRDPAPTHAPPAQVSVIVHAFWSSQDAALNVWAQPVAGSHESSVQGLPSSQSFAGPGAQALSAQASPTVHASPSLQGSALGV